MKTHTSRRMNPSFGYNGALLNHSNTYSYHRRPPFSRIKEIYGEELERFELEQTTTEFTSKKLLAQQQKEIRYRVKEQIRKERNRNIIISCFMTAFSVLFLYLVNRYFLNLIEFLNV